MTVDSDPIEKINSALNYLGDDILSQRIYHYRFVEEDDDLVELGNTADRCLTAVWEAVREREYQKAQNAIQPLRNALRELSKEDWVVKERSALGRVTQVENELKTLRSNQ